MKSGKYVFSQILELLTEQRQFDQNVKEQLNLFE
jgi:hypothetical protein